MSHFTVLVIGNNPEEQLAPYHQFECTGRNDKYVQEIDETERMLADYAANQDDEDVASKTFPEFVEYWSNSPRLEHGEKPDIEDIHKWGWTEVNQEGQVVRVIRRTNPNAKWDWYQLGGRWTGFFKMKDKAEVAIIGKPGLMTDEAKEGHADRAIKGDIDFEGMFGDAVNDAAIRWDKIHDIVGHTIDIFTPWSVVRERYPNIEEARTVYHAQPAKVLLNGANESWVNLEDFMGDREDFLNAARNGALQTFAIVKDGQWYERGSMGWWAVVSDEMDKGEWDRKFTEMLNALSDDTMLSVYDCHI